MKESNLQIKEEDEGLAIPNLRLLFLLVDNKPCLRWNQQKRSSG